jgi:hypothetical protein
MAKSVVITGRLSCLPRPSRCGYLGVRGRLGGRLFDLNGSRGLPYDLREGIDLNSSSFYVLETDWNSTGAQEFPFGVVIVSNETISQKLNESSVFYVGGPLDSQFVGFWTR